MGVGASEYAAAMRCIAVQTAPVWHDVAENRRRIEGAIDASGFGAGDYVVLPEMCETAWTTEVAAFAASADSVDWFGRVARARGIWLQAGFGERRENGRFSNSACVIGPEGRLRAVYRKNFLFPSERDAFDAGTDLCLIDTGAAVVCPLVCYDLRFPELWRLAARAGAEVFAVSSSWPAVRHEHWRALLVARAIENQACVIAANRCGSDPSNEYAGGSVAVSVLGVRIDEAGAEERSVALPFERAEVDAWRARFGALRDTRASLLGNTDIRRA